MAGMVLLMEIPCLLMIGTLHYKTDGETRDTSAKDDDIKHSNTSTFNYFVTM
jgi:hypothetical protein